MKISIRILVLVYCGIVWCPLAFAETIELESISDARKTDVGDKPNAKVLSDAYKIDVGDKLNIKVQGEKDLTGIFVVHKEGTIRYPLLGEVQAEGFTPEELNSRLYKALSKDFIVNPQIEVIFEESLSKSVTVVGEIEKPGNYILPPNTTLLKFIFQAGGSRVDPSKIRVKVIRAGGVDKQEFVKLDLSDIIEGKEKDVVLLPGDMVFVHSFKSEAHYKETVSILGQVKKPGNLTIVPDMTLIKLVAEAGGFTDVALTSHVKIVRFSKKGEETVLYVNAGSIMEGKAPDVELQAGDLVIVPETFF